MPAIFITAEITSYKGDGRDEVYLTLVGPKGGRKCETLSFEAAADLRNDLAAKLPPPKHDLLAALKLAAKTIAGTLDARGYKHGECTDGWVQSVRDELRTLASIKATIAAAETSVKNDEFIDDDGQRYIEGEDGGKILIDGNAHG